ncbi:pentatricopeptide repeat-containing protein At5g66520-like [Phoenix dactylifera]|uniref:Pentatricopeptide repeat-containing protein At5g66520-like n=1 Tax=Phoenix dactylifera TaxID=42345 RepID=A0A8B7CPJ8_PHODC|nr:pentatricopeptide repeat-containing protein At5g66520-like [Phoenix dactylifera]
MRRGISGRTISALSIPSSHPPPNPTIITTYPYLSLLETSSTVKEVKQLHAHAIALDLVRYTYVTSRILALYAFHPNPDIHSARLVFDRIPEPTIFNWNTMIKAHSRTPHPEKGLLFYSHMRRRGLPPNMHTFPFAIKACARLSSLSQIHGQIVKFGFYLDVFVTSSLIRYYSHLGRLEFASQVFDESSNRNLVCWTSLISAHCARGLVDRAREIFERMSERNEVSWSAIITGYVQNDRPEEAIELFRELKRHGSVKLNDSLLVSVLNACAGLGAVEEGRWIHDYIDRRGTHYGVELGTALLDFYSKCGFIESAREVFCKMACKDVTAWSAMVMGQALNGLTHSAIETFSEMLGCKVMPNAVTFVGVLTACNHGGLVDEGWAYLEDMSRVYGLSPTIEHYGCVVDLLSRAGRTAEAERLIRCMPMEPDGAIWGALLHGCLMHGNAELGERVGRRVIELEPHHCGRYVGLANVYAAMGRWEGAVKVRRAMRDRGVAPAPGWSLIEINGVGHRFLADDKGHPRQEEIYRMLGDLSMELVS